MGFKAMIFIRNNTTNACFKAIARTVLLGSGLLFISTHIFAGEKINKSLDVDANSLVEIIHVKGDAKIIGWDKNTVKVEGELGDNTEAFRFERDGKSVVFEVEVKQSGSKWGWSNEEGKEDALTIHVPFNSRVNYRSPNAELDIEMIYGGVNIEMINGDLQASDLKGRMSLKTVNGDIKASKLSGELSIDAVNGDIEANHISGNDLSVNTVNGDVEIDSKAQDVFAETVNGDIEITLDKVLDVKTNTVNGDIDMSMTLIDGGSVKASSVGGDIEFEFQKDIQAKFNIEAHAGGSIQNKINQAKANKAKYGPRIWLEFSSGKPTATVNISTVHGSIELETQ